MVARFWVLVVAGCGRGGAWLDEVTADRAPLVLTWKPLVADLEAAGAGLVSPALYRPLPMAAEVPLTAVSARE